MKLTRILTLLAVLILAYVLTRLETNWRTTMWGIGPDNVMWLVTGSNLVFAASIVFLFGVNLRKPEPEAWLGLVYALLGLLIVHNGTPLQYYLRSWLGLTSPVWFTSPWDKFALAGAFVLLVGLLSLVRQRTAAS